MNQRTLLTGRRAVLGAVILGVMALANALTPFARAATQATLTVTSIADGGAGSLRQVILDAASGDTIVFDGVLFASAQTIQLTNELVINKDLIIDGSANGVYTPTIKGPGPGSTYFRVVNIDTAGVNVTLKRLIIDSGNLNGASVSLGAGAGIYTTGNLTVTDCLISNNLALNSTYGQGGGIYSAGGALTIVNSTIYTNTGTSGGALYLDGGTAIVDGSVLSSNAVTGTASSATGAGVYVSTGVITITHNSVITGNKVITGTNSGGGILMGGGTLYLLNSTVAKNVAGGQAGGILIGNLAAAYITDSTIFSNTITRVASNSNGGGIVAGGSVTVTNSIISNNAASGYGGGIQFSGSGGHILTVVSSTIANNSATTAGGGIYVSPANGPAHISGSVFSGNTNSNGSAIATSSGANALFITGTAFLNNSGSAVNSQMAVNLANSNFSGNTGAVGSGLYMNTTTYPVTLTQVITTTNDFYIRSPFINNGTFTQTGGTTTFAGSAGQPVTGTGTTTFMHVNFANTTGVVLYTPLSLTGYLTKSGLLTQTAGTLSFVGTGVQNLNTTNVTTFTNLAIGSDSIVNEVVAASNVTVNGTLTNNGIIRKRQTISAAGAYAFGLAGGPINGANLSLNVTADAFTYITVDRYDRNHANRTGTSAAYGVGWGNYWAITPTGSGTVNVTLPTAFAAGANTKACRYAAGAGWNCAATSYTANTVTRNGVSTFSDWASGNASPTAVTLRDLSAAANISPIANGVLGAALLALGLRLLGWRVKAKAQR